VEKDEYPLSKSKERDRGGKLLSTLRGLNNNHWGGARRGERSFETKGKIFEGGTLFLQLNIHGGSYRATRRLKPKIRRSESKARV